MKRILSIVLLVLVSISTFAVVAIDKTDENGSRSLLSKKDPLYKIGTHRADYSLACVDNEQFRFYRLIIDFYEGKIQLKKGDRLLLKFDDGSIMELRSVEDIGPYDYKIKDNGEICVSVMYEISEEQLAEGIKGKKLVKIRVEYSLGEFDREIVGILANMGIELQYICIKQTLETKKDFYDDF